MDEQQAVNCVAVVLSSINLASYAISRSNSRGDRVSNSPAVLMVEDSDSDAELVLLQLQEGFETLEVRRVASSRGVRQAMDERPFDIVLSDYHLVPEEFPAIAEAIRERDPDVPIIVVTGTIGEERAVEVMRSGAADLILKGNLSRLVPAIRRELDSSALREANREIRQRFADIIEVCGNWLWETNAEHRFTFISSQDGPNSSTPFDALGKTRWELAQADPKADDPWRAHLADLEAHRKFRDFRYEVTTRTGVRRRVSVSGVPLHRRDGAFAGYRGMSVDETDLHRAHTRATAAEMLLQDTIESISEGIAVFDSDDRFVLTNDAFRRMYSQVADMTNPGTRHADFLRAAASRGVHPDAAGREAEWIAEHLDDRGQANAPVLESLADGRFVLKTRRRMKNGGIAEMKMDVTRVKELEAERDHLARHDSLTGLPNKPTFIDYIRPSVVGAKRNGEIVAVISLRLTSLEDIVQSAGLQAGDEAILEVAARLREVVTDEETHSYVGGGQFLLLLVGMHNKAEVLASAERLSKRLVASFRHKDEEIPFKIAIGISTAPGDSIDAQVLVRNATTAMHQACQHRTDIVQFYDEGMTKAAVLRSKTESELKRAIEADELFLLYQPQVDAHNNSLSGMEALVRWRHPDRGLVMPNDFIAVAEETGLIVPIGDAVLRMACEQASRWRRRDRETPIAINVSAVQLTQHDFAEKVLSILDRNGLPPSLIALELTESAVMREFDAASLAMQRLSKAGVPFALDDFGIEQSSLAYLSNLPFKTLKIDRAFVRKMTGNRGQAAMIHLIISMAHSLGMEAIAEGVEDDDQVIYLRAYGCDKLQGYLFGRPMTAEDLEQQFPAPIVAPASFSIPASAHHA